MSDIRKVFNLNNLQEFKLINKRIKCTQFKNTISAAGCIFYKVEENKVQLMLISYTDPDWQLLDDFGGKVEESDKSVYETIARETYEESNGVIKKYDVLLMLLQCKARRFYTHRSKYLCYAIKVDESFYPDTAIGDSELDMNLKKTEWNRNVNWYNYSDIKEMLSHRLKNNGDIIAFFDNIENERL